MNRSTRKTVARFAPLTSQARTRAGHPASRLAAPGKARNRSRQQDTVGLPAPHGPRPYESQSCTPVTRSKFGKANCHRQARNALETTRRRPVCRLRDAAIHPSKSARMLDRTHTPRHRSPTSLPQDSDLYELFPIPTRSCSIPARRGNDKNSGFDIHSST